jgi:hypothetical protein
MTLHERTYPCFHDLKVEVRKYAHMIASGFDPEAEQIQIERIAMVAIKAIYGGQVFQVRDRRNQ